MPALTVFGATGYTGRLVAAEALRAGMAVRLAGRRRDGLEALAAELGGGVGVAVADAEDAGSLEQLAATSDVLVSTVGPFAEQGRPVVEAVLAAGCRYVDTSAEVDFVSWVYAQHDRARQASALLCPAVGFDGAVGDLLVRLAANSLGEGVHEARVGYLVRGGRVSAGSARSGIGVMARGGVALVGGELVDEPLLSHTWVVPFPPPLGALVGVSIPAPEVLTAARSVGARDARAYLALPGGTGVVGRAGAAFASLAGIGGQRAAGSRLAGPLRAVSGWLPPGPSPAARERSRCALLAEVTGPAGTRRAWLRLRDIYGTTARIAVGVAARLLAAPAGESGVRTPAEAVGDPGRFLAEVGARWEMLPSG